MAPSRGSQWGFPGAVHAHLLRHGCSRLRSRREAPRWLGDSHYPLPTALLAWELRNPMKLVGT